MKLLLTTYFFKLYVFIRIKKNKFFFKNDYITYYVWIAFVVRLEKIKIPEINIAIWG